MASLATSACAAPGRVRIIPLMLCCTACRLRLGNAAHVTTVVLDMASVVITLLKVISGACSDTHGTAAAAAAESRRRDVAFGILSWCCIACSSCAGLFGV